MNSNFICVKKLTLCNWPRNQGLLLFFNTFDNLWQYLRVLNFFESFNNFLIIFDNFQQCWQFLTIFNNLDNFWQFLTILTIFDNFGKFWQFWPFLQFFTIFTILKFIYNFDYLWHFLQFLTILTIIDNSYNCFYHFDNWKDNPGDLWHLRQFFQLRIGIHDNLCYLTVTCDTGQHSQFVRCFVTNQLIWCVGCSTYRVFFFTGTPPKSSKYRKVNLG